MVAVGPKGDNLGEEEGGYVIEIGDLNEQPEVRIVNN
jgi:hypothetical protein